MEYSQTDDRIILKNPDSFNITQILECGQCFRFVKTADNEYRIIAMGKILNIRQSADCAEFYPCTLAEFENIWKKYFDLDTDYSSIKEKLSRNDEIMSAAIEYGSGIRLLNQDPSECLISFIISQNNNIPRIKGIIKRLSETYGTKEGNDYLFPSLSQLADASEDDFFKLRMGFRARYVKDCVDKLVSGKADLENTQKLTTAELLESLMQIKGVGQKVADCVMLFSLGRREVFPTDVWIKRIMEKLYFDDKETSIKEIHAFAEDKWGSLAGYAQQYLYYYSKAYIKDNK